ncbi:basic salivary proline-rich protein 1-like [Panthera leo]|uniref:basic salivary proline-rich protein 1-like n=1 Tax=Panthera leo TaxID=9689 RepID=UPI001C6965FA|nr:basic salivary proline-rich protein 1-like [Panthera leo]
MASAAFGPVMAAPGPSPRRPVSPSSLSSPRRGTSTCAPRSGAPRSPRAPRAPRPPSRAAASSGGLGTRQLRGEAGRAQSRPPARGRIPERPPAAAPGPPLRSATARFESHGGLEEAGAGPGRSAGGPVRPAGRARGPGRRGERGARPRAPPGSAAPRPPRGGLARSSRPRASEQPCPRPPPPPPPPPQPSRPGPGPAPRLAEVPGVQRSPAVQGAPGAARPRDTHRPQPAGLRPHSAPGPDPRTCSFPRSPLSGWA